MTRLVLAALAGFIALGFMASASTAQAAPPRAVQCTGTSSVWDDTDIVHLTVPLGSGDDRISWRTRSHTTLNCGAGSPLTGQVAQIEQIVDARFAGRGRVQGRGVVRITVAGMDQSVRGRFSGTTTVNQGTLGIAGDFDGDADVDGNDFLALKLRMRQHGSINLATKQASGFYIDDIIIGLKKP